MRNCIAIITLQSNLIEFNTIQCSANTTQNNITWYKTIQQIIKKIQQENETQLVK